MVNSLREFFDEVEAPDRNLVVVDQASPQPVRKMLDSLVEDQPVSISDVGTSDDDSDLVALVENREVIAQSTVKELMETVLLVNSDLYRTGTIDLHEVELPAVLKGLDEVPFRLRGYPESNKEKLLLIMISRMIERIAAETGRGTHRASFQQLSRLRDEQGTYEAYQALSETDVAVHVYGVGDIDPAKLPDVNVHPGDSFAYRQSWFVVFVPPKGAAADHAALLAIENEPNVWDGFWTFRPELVTKLADYIKTTVQPAA